MRIFFYTLFLSRLDRPRGALVNIFSPKHYPGYRSSPSALSLSNRSRTIPIFIDSSTLLGQNVPMKQHRLGNRHLR
jgi:hypothetical protein